MSDQDVQSIMRFCDRDCVVFGLFCEKNKMDRSGRACIVEVKRASVLDMSYLFFFTCSRIFNMKLPDMFIFPIFLWYIYSFANSLKTDAIWQMHLFIKFSDFWENSYFFWCTQSHAWVWLGREGWGAIFTPCLWDVQILFTLLLWCDERRFQQSRVAKL